MILPSVAALLVATTIAANAASLNKCTDAGGNVLYTDTRCPGSQPAAPVAATPPTTTDAVEQARKREREAKDAEAQANTKRAYEALKAQEGANRAILRAGGPAAAELLSAGITYQDWANAEQLCAAQIGKDMRYLEPMGAYGHLGAGTLSGEIKLRVAVRLADSFRAAPVGVVECEVDNGSGMVRLTKVRM